METEGRIQLWSERADGHTQLIAEQPRITEPREDAQEAQKLNATAEGVVYCENACLP